MKVIRITLAVHETEGMVAFYNKIFQCGLAPISGSPIFLGSFAGVEFQLCPNALAGVIADQNRHQFRLAVEDPEELAASVESAGGTIVNRSEGDGRPVIGIADPEGNTMELVASA